MTDPPLLRMPLHLLSLVLALLDSTPTLASAILSHSSLYAAFDEDRDRIIRSILRNQISPELMVYAFPTYLSTLPSFDPHDLEKTRSFLRLHIERVFEFRLPVQPDLWTNPGPVDIHLATTLSRRQVVIEKFTRDFVQDTLPLRRAELGLPLDDDRNLASDAEVFRIHRAMYRYQLYCNIFRHTCNVQQLGRWGTSLALYFFAQFSPWVNEQLACIHDYFERVLSRAFDEVAAHDVEWGFKHRSINWLTVGGVNTHKQAYLLQGLDFLFKLSQATTFSERRALLQAVNPTSPPSTRHMLGRTFKYGSTDFEREDWYYFWDHIDESRILSGRTYYTADSSWPSNGPDGYFSGPFRWWRNAHEDCWRRDVIYHADNAWLRRCGYVLWDLPKTPVTDHELRVRILRARQKALLDRFRRKDSDLKRKAKQSRKERIAIYKLGGRGYWREGDLSQVVWTEGAPETSAD